MTSTLKTRPAMGALKIDAIAPAVPHPTNVILCRSFNFNNFARLEPMADPLMTTGTSGPADPPLPMVRKLDINLEKLDRSRNNPPYLDTE